MYKRINSLSDSFTKNRCKLDKGMEAFGRSCSCGKRQKGALSELLPRYEEEIVKYEAEVLGIDSNNFKFLFFSGADLNVSSSLQFHR